MGDSRSSVLPSLCPSVLKCICPLYWQLAETFFRDRHWQSKVLFVSRSKTNSPGLKSYLSMVMTLLLNFPASVRFAPVNLTLYVFVLPGVKLGLITRSNCLRAATKQGFLLSGKNSSSSDSVLLMWFSKARSRSKEPARPADVKSVSTISKRSSCVTDLLEQPTRSIQEDPTF